MKKTSAVVIATLFAGMSFSQDIVNNKFGKGLYNVVAKDSSYSMKFGIRMQSLFIGEWDVNDSSGLGAGNTQFLVRRSRLKFGGFAHSTKLIYKVELGLTNRDISGVSSHTKGAPRVILDAVVKWNFYKNFTLWVGQTKLPGNRERVVSSGNLQLVDRSLLNSRFNIDRDMGVQLHHKHKVGKALLIEKVSVSQGEGRNITDKNLGGYQWTGRIEFLPFGKFASKGDYIGAAIKKEDKPKLSIAGTYDFHDRAVKNRSNMGSYMVNDAGFYSTDISTLFIDAMLKYKALSIMVEIANRIAEDAVAKNTDGTETGDIVNVGSGTNFQMGYMLKNNWEIAGRYTSIVLDKNITGKDVETQYTLGLSKYVVGHKLKVQSDVSYLTVENDPDSQLMFRVQVDIHL